jgi:hypothetical protein
MTRRVGRKMREAGASYGLSVNRCAALADHAFEFLKFVNASASRSF